MLGILMQENSIKCISVVYNLLSKCFDDSIGETYKVVYNIFEGNVCACVHACMC